jgi:hypothetical protein
VMGFGEGMPVGLEWQRTGGFYQSLRGGEGMDADQGFWMRIRREQLLSLGVHEPRGFTNFYESMTERMQGRGIFMSHYYNWGSNIIRSRSRAPGLGTYSSRECPMKHLPSPKRQPNMPYSVSTMPCPCHATHPFLPKEHPIIASH